jgi:hypothetical protein
VPPGGTAAAPKGFCQTYVHQKERSWSAVLGTIVDSEAGKPCRHFTPKSDDELDIFRFVLVSQADHRIFLPCYTCCEIFLVSP